jgi:hypothetical protein
MFRRFEGSKVIRLKKFEGSLDKKKKVTLLSPY